MRFSRFSRILLSCIALSLLNISAINTVYAEPKDSKQMQLDHPGKIYGKVTDIINVAGYTYAEIDTGKEKVWAAGPTTPLKAGETVAFSSQMPMQNFHSKSIDRTFPVVYFINRFITNNETPTTASAHAQTSQPASKPIENIDKVEGGNTIIEIYADKNNLKGKTVRVRGQVTKFSANVMGKNWVHIVDSSSPNDLTITTNAIVSVGDIVVAEGKIELDKDYSYGYLYPVIMEQATITKQ